MSFKTDMLILRACRSDSPLKNVNKLYERYYYKDKYNAIRWEGIAKIMLRICDKYCHISTYDLVEVLNPAHAYKTVKDDKNYFYEELVAMALIVHVRQSELSDIAYYIMPICYRNMD